MSGDPYTRRQMDAARARRADARDEPLRRAPRRTAQGARVGYTRQHAAERPRALPRGLHRGARPLAGAARRARLRRARPAASSCRRPVSRRRPGHGRRRRRGRRRGRAGPRPSEPTSTDLGVDARRPPGGARQARARRMRNLESTWLFLERGDASLVSRTSGRHGPPSSRCGSSRPRRPSGRASPRRSTTGRPRPCRTRSSRSSTSSGSSRRTSGWPGPSSASCASSCGASSATSATFISQLRPPVLDELGLDGAITRRGRARWPTLTGVDDRDRPGRPRTTALTTAQQTVVLRVVQEALQNVRKHAAATSSSIVTTARRTTTGSLEVRDDGRGFDVGAVAARGRRNFGLQFMRERAELIGATIRRTIAAGRRHRRPAGDPDWARREESR